MSDLAQLKPILINPSILYTKEWPEFCYDMQLSGAELSIIQTGTLCLPADATKDYWEQKN